MIDLASGAEGLAMEVSAEIRRFNSHAVTAEDIVQALDSEGAIIIEGVISQEQRDRLHQELDPFIAATELGRDSFSGQKTTRTGALAARSAAARELILNPLALTAARAFLGRFCERVQLHVTQVIRILPGQTAQPLHRDRWAWGQHLPLTVEPQFNTMWALTDFTRANGATLVAPGSNAGSRAQPVNPAAMVAAEMPAGSVLFFSGSVVHGGGANQTESERIGINIDYCLDWLRQEENQYLSCPPEVAASLEPELQALLGYTYGATTLGYFSQPSAAMERAGVLPPEAALEANLWHGA